MKKRYFHLPFIFITLSLPVLGMEDEWAVMITDKGAKLGKEAPEKEDGKEGPSLEDLLISKTSAGSLNNENKPFTLPKGFISLSAWELATQLTHLNLSRTHLKTLPLLEAFTNLIILNVGSNQIKKLSSQIKNLKNLVFLRLDHNQLKILPKEVGELSQLEMLALDHNPLEILPPEIKNLNRLEYLYLHQTNLKTLPSGIITLPHIMKITPHVDEEEGEAITPASKKLYVTQVIELYSLFLLSKNNWDKEKKRKESLRLRKTLSSLTLSLHPKGGELESTLPLSTISSNM